MSLQDAASNFYRKVWVTKGSRFSARARLRLMNILSVSTITILSTYLITISVLGILFQSRFSDFGQNFLNATNISLSVAILAFSLIEFSRNHLGSSETMHMSAIAISRIYDQFQIKFKSGTLTLDELQKFSDAYIDVIEKCPLNHDTIDYEKFQLEHPKEFALEGLLNAPRRLLVWFTWWGQATWLYVLAIAIPPFAMAWVLCNYKGLILV